MYEHKRGATFFWTVTFRPRSTGASTLAGYTVTSSFKDRSGNTTALTVTVADDDLSFVARATPTQTAAWALGEGQIDAKLVADSDATNVIILPTETINITVGPTP
jgi:hypothetical protein